ncbi:MAG: hypothetical protein IKE24_04185 [Clostridia bacterium]|nr:hypothetical protein [Clostridia bacterium]
MTTVEAPIDTIPALKHRLKTETMNRGPDALWSHCSAGRFLRFGEITGFIFPIWSCISPFFAAII